MSNWLIIIAYQPVRGYFYTKKLRNHLHVHIFCVAVSQVFFFFLVVGGGAHQIKSEWFLNRSIGPVDGTWTGTINPRQSGPGSNGN